MLNIDESGFYDLDEEEAYAFALNIQNKIGLVNSPSFVIKGYFGINTCGKYPVTDVQFGNGGGFQDDFDFDLLKNKNFEFYELQEGIAETDGDHTIQELIYAFNNVGFVLSHKLSLSNY